MTPKYGINKQIFYRNVILDFVEHRYRTKALEAITLGGAHCLDDESSIERQLLNLNKKTKLFIVESDKKAFMKLKRKLSNIEFTINGKNLIAEGTFRGSKVTVFYGSLGRFFKCTSGDADLIIADYYSTLNEKVEIDVDTIIEKRILKRGASLFLTSSDAKRTCKTKAYKRILKHDYANKDYERGMLNFLYTKFVKNNIKLKYADTFQYDNKDIDSYATQMYVANLEVA